MSLFFFYLAENFYSVHIPCNQLFLKTSSIKYVLKLFLHYTTCNDEEQTQGHPNFSLLHAAKILEEESMCIATQAR